MNVASYSSSKYDSVLTALSRIEELDFDHEAGDVAVRARNVCVTCIYSESMSVFEEEI